ncbi:uncharacterized protein TRIVIDRAFT_155768 [Trichoderma virens Gv29-8]|uniref:Uncharacterized protein n=1 Tax=Hypocrea virens (strain Gv29-8 / FGSC 10586) TaxID=413071 RepID=G9N0Q6_HYPVG|nr:uncharacterized protein TRIVIDRAFT_155768 [Trichoderma virens Gv29-8]EHK19938.1 hypothetical protein TRIVIDRAFT_155768 [Trichoderma virens Gv29-8]
MDFFCCLCDDDHAASLSPYRTDGIVTEKPSLHPPIRYTIEETAENFIEILLCAEKSGALLSSQLEDAVFATGWSEWLAQNILKKLEGALRDGHEKMGPAMIEAYDQASKAAEITFPDLFEYVKEHPVEIAATVLLSLFAFGVLVRLAPLVLELLGFGELGPTAGSFAALWQSTYRGHVAEETLFSFFQRLGMTWRKV